MYLFKIKDLEFKEKDFLDNISEFEDIIPIIQDYQEFIKYELIQCYENNDCCNKTKENYLIEIKGFINEEDEFIHESELTKDELKKAETNLEPFTIQIYKCVDCNKWIINLLELED